MSYFLQTREIRSQQEARTDRPEISGRWDPEYQQVVLFGRQDTRFHAAGKEVILVRF